MGCRGWIAVSLVLGCGPAVSTSSGDASEAEFDSDGPSSSAGDAPGVSTSGSDSSVPPVTVGATSNPPAEASSDPGSESSAGPVASLCIEYSETPLNDRHVFADVSGDGVAEAWLLFPADGEQPAPNVQRHDVEGLAVEPQVYTEFVPADALGLADLTGDGHADLYAQWQGQTFVRAGVPGGTFAIEETPLLTTANLLSALNVDVDGDGDDDLVTISSEGLWLHENDGGALHSRLIPETQHLGAMTLESVVVAPGAEQLAISLEGADAENTMLLLVSASPLELEVMYISEFQAHRVLGVEVRGDHGVFTVWSHAAWVGQVDEYEFELTGVAQRPLLADIVNAAYGDFDGDGAADLLYTDAFEHRLLRLAEGIDEPVTLIGSPPDGTWPLAPLNFGGTGVGVLGEACGFVCEFRPAQLTDC